MSGNKTKSWLPIKRIELVYNATSYNFAVNPESYSEVDNPKLGITQTKGGAYVEMFGKGLTTIEFSGTTGYKNGTDDPDNGFKKLKDLRNLVTLSNNNKTDGASPSAVMQFYNYTDETYYYVVITKFQMSRNKSQPLLYRYTITMTALATLSEELSSRVLNTIGSAVGIENTYPDTPGIG